MSEPEPEREAARGSARRLFGSRPKPEPGGDDAGPSEGESKTENEAKSGRTER